jgi:hypothetical protein
MTGDHDCFVHADAETARQRAGLTPTDELDLALSISVPEQVQPWAASASWATTP